MIVCNIHTFYQFAFIEVFYRANFSIFLPILKSLIFLI
jgi:hypothetical protein